MEKREKQTVHVVMEQAVDGGFSCYVKEAIKQYVLAGYGASEEAAKADLFAVYEEVNEMAKEEGITMPELEYVFEEMVPKKKVILQVIRGKNDNSYDINLTDDDLNYSIFATGPDFESAKDDFFALYDEMRASYEERNEPFEEVVVEFGPEEVE